MAIEKELLDGLNMIAQGKEEGFNILYSHTYNYVYSKAKFIMKNEDDALDLTQETFIQAYRGIGSLEDANNIYGDTGWGNTLYGYFYVLADGSVQLVYDAHTINPDMTWFGAYPEYTDTPISLTSGLPASTSNLVTSTTDSDANAAPVTASPAIEDAVAENDIVVKVGNVNIPISSTWEEFLALAQVNNWVIADSLYPDPINQGYKHAYSKKGSVTTPQGDLLVCIMPNADYSGAEIKYIALSPFYLESEDASILGITPSTDNNDIGKKYEVINNSDPYLYKVDEYVTLRVTLDTYNDKNTVTIERTPFEERE